MVKPREEVIAQFNEEVNMSADELQQWLEDPQSRKAGTGVGIESGHKIIEILRKNPTKDPDQYDDDDIEHMRKVVGYTNRHLAQEERLKDTKSREELENTKSTISLKNWGHDPIKMLDKDIDDDEVAKSQSDSEVESNHVHSDADGAQSSNDDVPQANNKSTQRGSEADVEGDEKAPEAKKRKVGDKLAPRTDELDDADESESQPRKRCKVDDTAAAFKSMHN